MAKGFNKAPGAGGNPMMAQLQRLQQQMAEAQDRGLVGQPRHGAVEPGELAVQRYVVQRLFHRRFGLRRQAVPFQRAYMRRVGQLASPSVV